MVALSKLCRISVMRDSDIQSVLNIQASNKLSYWSFLDYQNAIRDETFLKIVARINTKAVGFAIGRLIIADNLKYFPNQIINNEAEIHNIAVDNPHKNLGIGTRLISSLIEDCRLRSIKTIWLEVRESNLGVIEFYKKNNFKEIYTRKNYYNDPVENAIVMKLICQNDLKPLG